MRTCLIVLLLGGCSTTFDVAPYEPTCARQCLMANSDCAARTLVGHRAQCNANTEQCLKTCPAK